MKSEDWKILSTLYECRNLTRSAHYMFMSQPALSKRIQQIEKELDTTIAIRTRKGIAFTPQGEYLASRAYDYSQFMKETMDKLHRLSNGDEGMLNIATPSSVSRYLLPPILSSFQTHYQKVQYKIETYLSSTISKLIEENSFHIGFINCPPQPNVESIKISIGEAILYYNSKIDMDQLCTIPMISYHRDTWSQQLIHDWWMSFFKHEPLNRMLVNDVSCAFEMVKQGLGFCIVFNNFCSDEFKGDHLFQMPLVNNNGTAVHRLTYVIYHHENLQIPIVKFFIDHVKQIYGNV